MYSEIVLLSVISNLEFQSPRQFCNTEFVFKNRTSLVMCSVFFVFFMTPKSARDTQLREFCHGHFWLFTGILSKIFSGYLIFVTGTFPKIFTGNSENSRAFWKIVVTSTFRFVTGTFVLWLHFFFIDSSHNRGDIWSLTYRVLTIFSKQIIKKGRAVPIKLNYPLDLELFWRFSEMVC